MPHDPERPPSPTSNAHLANSRKRTSTLGSITQTGRKAAGSIGQATVNALNADPPLGAWAAAAEATSKAPTLGDIRKGSFAEDGWQTRERALARRQSSGDSIGRIRAGTGGGSASRLKERSKEDDFDREKAGLDAFPALSEEPTHTSAGAETYKHAPPEQVEEEFEGTITRRESISPPALGGEDAIVDTIHHLKSSKQRTYSSGYIPPPHLPWSTSFLIGLRGFWKWFLTPLGFLITIYALNVVAWGGMLFLLLCGAAPAMCWVHDDSRGWYKDCNDINSPRRIWLEIDSQILNALFCVTGFGLIPWRFRDLYYLLRWRCTSERRYGRQAKLHGLRTLAGINNGWFRLPGSDTLDEKSAAEYANIASTKADARTSSSDVSASPDAESGLADDLRLPLPLKKIPAPPLTGIRAPPTALWKLDFFIWANVWNTFFQACLCGFMWGMNRYTRPSWSTGLFIALACIIAGLGGFVTFLEGKRVKRVEGVAPSAAVEAEITRMEERELELGRVRTGKERKVVGEAKGERTR